jgi:hypothetical protein
MTDKKTHTLTLSNGAFNQLAQILGVPGLLTEPADLYRAGKIAEEHLLELPDGPSVDQKDPASGKAFIAWARSGSHEVVISEKERETAKKAVTAAVAKGMVPAGPASMCLLRELGLAPEE